MEKLIDKIAGDLKSFAPEAPAGMEERIQSALGKKKSFWTFSWYSMNVYVVGFLLVGGSAFVLSTQMKQTESVSSLAPTQISNESIRQEKQSEILLLNTSEDNHVTEVKSSLVSGKNKMSASHSTERIKNSNEDHAMNAEAPAIEDVKPKVETAETVEVQNVSQDKREIQVPKPVNEVVKPKGRPLKLTRLTGK